MTYRTSSGAVPPKQRRSREAYERILDATERLLHYNTFDVITVNDMCEAAEVSPSSFYARFPSKKSVLMTLVDRLEERFSDVITSAVERVQGEGRQTIEEIATFGISQFLAFARANQHLFTACYADIDARPHIERIEREPFEVVRDRVAGNLVGPEGSSAVFLHRLRFALRVIGSSVHRAVGGQVHFLDRAEMTDEEFVHELALMTTAYLRSAP